MWRALVFIGLLALAAFGAVWLADRPGNVVVTWGGYQAQTSVAVAAVLTIGHRDRARLPVGGGDVRAQRAEPHVLCVARAAPRQGLCGGVARHGRGRSRRSRRRPPSRRRGRAASRPRAADAAPQGAGGADRRRPQRRRGRLPRHGRGCRDARARAARPLRRGAPARRRGRGPRLCRRGGAARARRRLGERGGARGAMRRRRLARRARDGRAARLARPPRQGDGAAPPRRAPHRRRARPPRPRRGRRARQRARGGEARARSRAGGGRRRPGPVAARRAAQGGEDRRGGVEDAAASRPRRRLHELCARAIRRSTACIGPRPWRSSRPGTANRASRSPARRSRRASSAAPARCCARSSPTARRCAPACSWPIIEQAEHGVTGQVREWLARASRAPRDPAWIADGVVSDRWAPVSPVTGRLDAFVWEAPPDVLAGPGAPIDDVVADLDDKPRIAIPAPTAPQVEESQPSRRSRDGGGGSRAGARRAGTRGQRRRQRLGAGAARGGSCGRAGGLSGRPCAGRSRTRERGREAGPPPPLRLTPARPHMRRRAAARSRGFNRGCLSSDRCETGLLGP